MRLKNKKTIILLVIILFVLTVVSSTLFFYSGKKKDNEGSRILPIRQLFKLEFAKEMLLPEKKPVISDSAVKFGVSENGTAISGYIFGEGTETILLMGAIHGNEKSSTTLLNQIAKDIGANKSLVGKNKKVIVIPLVNPDGYAKGLEKVNARNVNLNLNFETKGWKQYGGEDNKYFAGSQPFSESESRIIRDVVLKYSVKKMISFHAKGSLVNPEIHALSEELARWYVSKTGYSFFEDITWDYPGTATKWFTEAVGGPAITVELPDFTDPDITRNREAIFGLIK